MAILSRKFVPPIRGIVPLSNLFRWRKAELQVYKTIDYARLAQIRHPRGRAALHWSAALQALKAAISILIRTRDLAFGAG